MRKSIIRACVITFTIIFIVAVLFYIFTMQSRPDLKIWHKADLAKEVTAADIKTMSSLEDYIKRENQLFDQLDEQIYRQTSEKRSLKLNRFLRGSWSDPNRFKQNWNRTIELPAKLPKAGVLMLHGMSDSPYSMRSLALNLNSKDNWVVALRLPGHGTAPSGLCHAEWMDFAAAVRLAAQHIHNQIGPDKPLYIVGYSNGAALALEYALSEMLGEKLVKPEGLILISPAVAVSPAAILARLFQILADLPGLEKLAWLSIKPEYDPYKYNSFPVNAGGQVYKLTKRINSQLEKLDKGNGVKNFPPTLALQSAVDATLPSSALIDKLMARLSSNGHKLVIFDINRKAAEMVFLKNELQPAIEKMMTKTLPFTFSFLTNQDRHNSALEIRDKGEMDTKATARPLEATWPPGIYSLSHVALPFPASDPLYGRPLRHDGSNFTLGSLEARGEKGVLQIPISDLMRLRYNPFYDYLEKQVQEWIHPHTSHSHFADKKID